MDHIISLSAKHERLALKEPFETAKRRAEASDTVFVELVTESGVVSRGAATPVYYVTGETVDSVVSAVEAASPAVIGRSVRHYSAVFHSLGESLPDSPSARAAVESALVDAAGKIFSVPSYALFGGVARSVETDVTIPVVAPEHAGELAASAFERGFRFFKVKVGSKDQDEDLARVFAISRAAPASRLVLDANQGFLPDEAVNFIALLRDAGVNIEIFEQPVDKADVEGLAQVSAQAGVPVFADESVHTPADAVRLAAANAVHGVNVKLMKSGFFGALQIASVCRSLGLGLMLGCMLEPREGITAALHAACASEGFGHFDLDADMLLAEEGCGGFIRNGAWIYPTAASGLDCVEGPEQQNT